MPNFSDYVGTDIDAIKAMGFLVEILLNTVFEELECHSAKRLATLSGLKKLVLNPS